MIFLPRKNAWLAILRGGHRGGGDLHRTVGIGSGADAVEEILLVQLCAVAVLLRQDQFLLDSLGPRLGRFAANAGGIADSANAVASCFLPLADQSVRFIPRSVQRS